jgi:hypothetical protein
MQRYTICLYLETALRVSGDTSTHHQERIKCIYSSWYLSHRYCYLPLSWKSWDWFECAVGGVRGYTAPQTHESDSSDRPMLEDTTNPTTHGDWRLYVQNWEAPDDGRKSARNM